MITPTIRARQLMPSPQPDQLRSNGSKIGPRLTGVEREPDAVLNMPPVIRPKIGIATGSTFRCRLSGLLLDILRTRCAAFLRRRNIGGKAARMALSARLALEMRLRLAIPLGLLLQVSEMSAGREA